MNLIDSLKNIGLNEKEAKIYIALLQIEKGSAYTLAQRSGLKKATAYVVLEELLKKNIVEKIPRSKIALYKTIPPTELFAMARARLLNAEKESLAELQALDSQDDRKIRVYYYQGEMGIKKIYERQLNKNNFLKRFILSGNKKKLSAILKKDLKNINSQLEKKGKNFFFNLSYYHSDISIEIVDEHIYIYSSKTLESLEIKSVELADALVQILKMNKIDKKTDKRFFV